MAQVPEKKVSGTAVVDLRDGGSGQGSGPGGPVVSEAKKRFERCSSWESPSRTRFVDDIRFANGDSDNGYQWPNSLRRNREIDAKPCLTINVIHQHNLQISNQARKNKSSVKFLPQGNGATALGATMMNNLSRRIERISDAQSAYTRARNFQIEGGIGYWRIKTDYAGPQTFDQDIFIEPVVDPLAVYLDPDIKKLDGSDANFGFVFDNMPKEVFDQEFPDFKDKVGENSPLGIDGADDDWLTKDHVRVAEYFRKVAYEDTLVSFVWQGQRQTVLKSKLARNMLGILDDPNTKTRPTQREEVEWYLIAGSQVIDSTVWVGKYIPLIRVIGEETIIDGIMDRKGHTRSMKDSQRMYNYNASAQVEFVALQGKTPWVAAAESIEEYETMWNTANTTNHSVLVYKPYDDQGQQLPPPQRTTPPTASPGYQAGMETAFNQIMMASGQWQNQMGMMGNERTGAAIGKRQRQSETAVFHFQDNYEAALIFTGKQLLDLIPKVYDTKRLLVVQGDNDEDLEVMIDPQAQQAFQQQQAEDGSIASMVFNPAWGDYAIGASVGPEYGSKRDETTEALSLILTQAPQLVPIIGDILLGSMDFDKAQEAAQRLRRLVPPQAMGQGPSQQEQLLGQQVQALTKALAESLQKQADSELKLVGKNQMRDIDAYKANTDRMKALSDALPLEPDGLRQMIEQLVQDSLTTSLAPLVSANASDLSVEGPKPQGTDSGEVPPMEGATKAPDGQWYLKHPAGGYLKVVKNGK